MVNVDPDFTKASASRIQSLSQPSVTAPVISARGTPFEAVFVPIDALGFGLALQRVLVGLVEPSIVVVSIDGSLPPSFRLAPLRATQMPSSPQMASKRSQSSLLAHCTAFPNRSAHDNTEIAMSAPSRDSERRGYPFMASSPRTRDPTR